MLTRLAPGIMDSSDLHFARPMDNGNLGGIVANGVQGGNEFTIDGAPNLSNAKGVGFSPPSGAIAQFKVQTNAFDAQTGHTAGAVVNLALKSGTNSFNGEGGYFNRDANRTATPLLTERAGGTKPTRTYNRVTGTVTGPIVRQPHVLHGVGRASARRPARAVHVHGADDEDAPGRLQRVLDAGVQPVQRHAGRRARLRARHSPTT